MNYCEFMYPGECLVIRTPRGMGDEETFIKYLVSLRKDESGSNTSTSNGIDVSTSLRSPRSALKTLEMQSGDTLQVMHNINYLCFADVGVEKVMLDEDGIKLVDWFDALDGNTIGNLIGDSGRTLVEAYRDSRDSSVVKSGEYESNPKGESITKEKQQ